MSLRSGEHPKSLLNILLEVVLISLGVFLALLANNWHEEREHHVLAESALRNFADEMQTNRQAVQKERQYHEELARELDQFLASNEPPTEEQFQKSVHFLGVRPVIFEHTAWDLALATQALAYLKPELAFDISRIYTKQSEVQTLQNSLLASVYNPTTFASNNVKGLVSAIKVYLGDINQQEPAVLQLCDKVIPEINQVLPRSSDR
jgi:hypothetical protein